MKQLRLPFKGWSDQVKACDGSGCKPMDIREVSLSNASSYSRVEGRCPVCNRWIAITRGEKLRRHMTQVRRGGGEDA